MMLVPSSRCRWPIARGRWAVRGRVERFVEPAVLLLLAEGPRHGYELKQDLRALAEDQADAANLYRALRQLELEGIVHSDWSLADRGPARRVYRLTSAGRRLLDQWAEALRQLGATTDAFLARYESLATGSTRRR